MKNVGPCVECKCEMLIPDALYEAARCNPDIYFYCGFGHPQHYSKTPRERSEDALRRERDRLTQRLAEKDDTIRMERERTAATERQLYAARGRITKIKNRVGHGVCPCCNRTFADLQRHMNSKHAGYAKSQDGDTATIN